MSLIVSQTSGNTTADRRFAWGAAAAAEGDHAAAADIFAQTLEVAPDFAAAAFGLGTAKMALGEHLAAGHAFQLALQLDSGDRQGAAMQLARLGARPVPTTAPPDYVRALFDAYAVKFDTHLAQALKYRAPQVLASLVAEVTQQRFARALDLGCGTGLAGEVFRPLCDHFEGCDLSPGMIEVAARKNIYDRLAVADLVTFLNRQPAASASLILAADVFVYIGDLAAPLQACAKTLAADGLLAFTVQKGVDGFALGPDLRYSHSLAYLAAMAEAAGLTLLKHPEISTRMDAGVDVPGLGLVLARR